MEDDSMRLMPTCKEVHRLTSEGLDRDLTMVERVRVRVHLVMCEACTNFTAQMQLIRRAMRKMGAADEPDRDPK
jgi:predicted anti-sigma-YlaC factor YlaD